MTIFIGVIYAYKGLLLVSGGCHLFTSWTQQAAWAGPGSVITWHAARVLASTWHVTRVNISQHLALANSGHFYHFVSLHYQIHICWPQQIGNLMKVLKRAHWFLPGGDCDGGIHRLCGCHRGLICRMPPPAPAQLACPASRLAPKLQNSTCWYNPLNPPAATIYKLQFTRISSVLYFHLGCRLQWKLKVFPMFAGNFATFGATGAVSRLYLPGQHFQ